LGPADSGQNLLDPARLAQLSFDQAWAMLVAQAKDSRVCRLGLTFSCDGEYVRRYGWWDPAVEAAQPCRWSIALTMCHREGQYCELRAGSAEALEPAASAGLAGVLKTFAAYFVNHAGQLPGLAVLGQQAAGSSRDPQSRKQAA
jgi:hypothetical protein